MITYYRKAWQIVGYTFHASAYCADCGESLPDTDPEGNPKHAVFSCDEIPDYWSCGKCGELSTDW